MKINNVEIMILKVGDPKANKNNEIYYMVDFAIIDGGDLFCVMVKNQDKIKEFKPFQKSVVDMELTSSKYGLSLKII